MFPQNIILYLGFPQNIILYFVTQNIILKLINVYFTFVYYYYYYYLTHKKTQNKSNQNTFNYK